MTSGSPLLYHCTYWFLLLMKWLIQEPSFFSVDGASLAQEVGKNDLYSDTANSSSSAFIPILPLRALRRLLRVVCILLERFLNRSISWKSTTSVGLSSFWSSSLFSLKAAGS